MSRSYANITTSIWRDPDFRKLSCNAQRLYLLMLTQADISSCGILPLTVKRWAANASDSDTDSLSTALRELEDSLFLVVDWDCEEVLVRTFVKWDGGANNEKRRPAILAAAKAIQSPVLMQVTAHELDKLGVAHTLPVDPVDSLSDALCHRHADRTRVVVTLGSTSTTPNPQPAIHNPVPARSAKANDRGSRLPDDWQPNSQLIEWVQQECPAVNGRAETQQFLDYWHSKPGKDGTKTRWDLAYQMWMRKAQGQAPSIRRTAPGRVTTDQRFVATLDLSQRLAQQEAANVRQIGAGS